MGTLVTWVDSELGVTLSVTQCFYVWAGQIPDEIL